jgi:signal transduction histidine kinase
MGATVDVRVARVNGTVEIVVADKGKGIAPDVLPFVFDRFWQEDRSSRRSHGGLGLGLAIVKHLVEMHDGTVSAESPGEGQGATFRVRLPALECPTWARTGLRCMQPPGRRKRVCAACISWLWMTTQMPDAG